MPPPTKKKTGRKKHTNPTENSPNRWTAKWDRELEKNQKITLEYLNRELGILETEKEFWQLGTKLSTHKVNRLGVMFRNPGERDSYYMKGALVETKHIPFEKIRAATIEVLDERMELIKQVLSFI